MTATQTRQGKSPHKRKSSELQPSLVFEEYEESSDSFAFAPPFVKWVGGKRRLLPHILAAAPQQFERYLEPFTGGGAVALALGHPVMLLNDANSDLMNTYRAIKDNVSDLIKLLNNHRCLHSEDYYYSIREQYRESLSPLEQAARLIYLNKTCFNGLYRVNKHGLFNVPYGKHEAPTLYNENNLYKASEALKGASIFTSDYLEFLKEHARKGDFIYLDPPYVPISKYSDFKRYTKEQFRDKEQKELADFFCELVSRGCYPILSNSWTASELYAEHDIVEIYAARNINKNSDGRTPVKEILVKPKLRGL